MAINGSVSVDWGDSSESSVVTGTSTSTIINTSHTYALGNYTIQITVPDGTTAYLRSSDSYPMICGGASTNSFYGQEFMACVKAIRYGNNMKFSSTAYYYSHLDSPVLIIPSGVTSISYMTSSNFKIISIPKSVTTISTQGLQTVDGLQIITLPYGLTTIGNGAFTNGNWCRTIYIPSTVTSITGNAFNDNRTKLSYHLMSTNPPALTTSGFTNMPSTCIIYVPYSEDHSILNAYQTATNWATYASKMQEEPQS